MGWLDWAIDDPAPGNCGYSFLNVPCEIDPGLRFGMTVHGAWGYWPDGRRPSATMAALGNSWGATVLQDGTTYKHRPRPTFVNWHGGGPAQNIGTEAIEAEGKGELWTPPQRASIARVCTDTWNWFGWGEVKLGSPTDRTQTGIRAALLSLGYGSFWQHNWFGYTTCPAGRDDWPWLVAEVRKGIAMATVKEITDLLNGMSHHQVFGKDMLLDQMRRISAAEETRAVVRHKAVLAAIKAIGTGSGGATPAQVEAILKRQKLIVG